jgi:hypothetical protein
LGAPPADHLGTNAIHAKATKIMTVRAGGIAQSNIGVAMKRRTTAFRNKADLPLEPPAVIASETVDIVKVPSLHELPSEGCSRLAGAART